MSQTHSEVSPETSGAAPPATPKTFGKFTIKGRLGHGGMGIVLDAITPEGQPVALKLIRPTGDPEKRKMFSARLQREAKILKVLSHPGVVRLVETGWIHGILYLAMERIDGKSLGVLLKRGPMDAELVLSLGLKIGDTLAHLHEIGIVHRDIKPDNVIIDQAGNPVLTDFGLSRLSGNTAITRQDELVGSLGYIAPEILEGAQPSPKTDQYALGRVLFNLGAGEPPRLENVPIFEQITRSLKTDWSRFPTTALFKPLGYVIRQMIRTRAENRFPDMYACLVELDNVLSSLAPAQAGGAPQIAAESSGAASKAERIAAIPPGDTAPANPASPGSSRSSSRTRPAQAAAESELSHDIATEKHPVLTAEQLRAHAEETDWSGPPAPDDPRPTWDDDTQYQSATGLSGLVRELAGGARAPWLAVDLNAPAALPSAELSVVDPDDEDGEYPCLSISVADFPAPSASRPRASTEDGVAAAADSIDLIEKMRKRTRMNWTDGAPKPRAESVSAADKSELALQLRKKTQAYWRSRLSRPRGSLPDLRLDQEALVEDPEAPQAAENWAHIVGDLIAPTAAPSRPVPAATPPQAVTEPNGQVPRRMIPAADATRVDRVRPGAGAGPPLRPDPPGSEPTGPSHDWDNESTLGLGASEALDFGASSSSPDLMTYENTEPPDNGGRASKAAAHHPARVDAGSAASRAATPAPSREPPPAPAAAPASAAAMPEASPSPIEQASPVAREIEAANPSLFQAPPRKGSWTVGRAIALGVIGVAAGFAIAIAGYHLRLSMRTELLAPETRAAAGEWARPVALEPQAGTDPEPLFRYEGDGPPQEGALEVAIGLESEALGAARRGDVERAQRMLGLCVKLADLPECHRALGAILSSQKSPAARAHYRRYLETTPEPGSADAESIRGLLDPPR